MHRLGILLFLNLFVISVFSQQDSIRSLHIQEVEVTTQIKPLVSQSGTLLQVVTGNDMQRIGVVSVSDAVRRFAGVSVKDYGGIGGLKTVSIRGLGAQHTAVSYDGVTISEAQQGQVDIGRFSLDNVSSLSLSIGQPDDIFQSARYFASAGVLNIKTNSPIFRYRNYQGNLTVRTGSFGLFNSSLMYAYKLSDVWSVSANIDWQRADGNYPFKFDEGSYKENRKRYNSDVDIWRTELNVYGNLKNAGILKLKAYYFDSERGLPIATISNKEYTGERLWDKNFFSQANYENKLSEKVSIQGLAKFSRNLNKYGQRTNNLGEDGYQRDTYTQFEYYASASVLYNPFSFLSFSLAQDYTHNRLHINLMGRADVNNETKYSTQKYYAHRNTSQTAFNAQLKTRKLTLTGGLLATYVTNEHDKGSVPKDLSRLSPAISVSYKPFDIGLRLRASYKDIFRVPTFSDIYFTGIGDRSLNPEKAQQYNVGATWIMGTLSALNFLSVSVDGYVNKVKDKIVLIGQSGYYWSMINMGDVTIKGIDVTLSSEVALSDKIDLLLNGSYGYQDAKEDDTDRRPSYTPKHFGSLALTIENPWLNITYSFVASDKRYGNVIAWSRYRIESFFDHSISANKTIKLSRYSNLRLQGEILNLSGKNYEVVRSYPMPGRSFRLSAGLTF